MDGPADTSVNNSRDMVGTSFGVMRNILWECINEDELQLLLNKNTSPICYLWFVPSPSMHITQGITKTLYVNKMLKDGYTVKILIADWFAQTNHKIGTDLSKIRTIGNYNIEVWKAVGMDLDRVEFVWLSDVMNCHAANIWPLVMDIGKKNIVGGIKRTAPYGPHTTEVFLPWLQCATILFHKEADIWLLDVDQRDVSILARKYCEDIKRENVPIILLNNMLPDLLEDPDFAEISDPSRAISMEDDERVQATGNTAAINQTLAPTGCDGGFLTGCDGVRVVVFIADYKRGTLHSVDVKVALKKAINKILQPVCDHFENNAYAKDLWQTTAGILYGN